SGGTRGARRRPSGGRSLPCSVRDLRAGDRNPTRRSGRGSVRRAEKLPSLGVFVILGIYSKNDKADSIATISPPQLPRFSQQHFSNRGARSLALSIVSRPFEDHNPGTTRPRPRPAWGMRAGPWWHERSGERGNLGISLAWRANVSNPRGTRP